MPRHARPVFTGIPHHVTQRGNRREVVFFSDDDRNAYLNWLGKYCVNYEVSVLAYCLMNNHVHLVAVPSTADGLERVFRALHTRYAQRLNRARNWKGHVWQGRYFSSALDEAYLWAAIRYVERNPVRAQIVRRAESYPWSSAAAHCGLREDHLLSAERTWMWLPGSIADWSGWLAGAEQPDQLNTLRRRVEAGLPCGTEGFIRGLEVSTGRVLRVRRRGRVRKTVERLD